MAEIDGVKVVLSLLLPTEAQSFNTLYALHYPSSFKTSYSFLGKHIPGCSIKK